MTLIKCSGYDVNYTTFLNKDEIITVDMNNVSWQNQSMNNAFSGCSNLEYVYNMNDNVKYMVRSYYGCSNLKEVETIPSSVTNMYYTFGKCSTINSIPTIPNSVANLSHAFVGCPNLVGNFYIKSNKVTSAERIFGRKDYMTVYYENPIRNVYLPFKNGDGTNSATYNAFIFHGYTETATLYFDNGTPLYGWKDGVRLINKMN